MPQHLTSQRTRVIAPLAALAAIVGLVAVDGAAPLRAAVSAPTDRERASFAKCFGPARQTCVVDGDTFWYRGTKIRVADINTPETAQPACPTEARLGGDPTADPVAQRRAVHARSDRSRHRQIRPLPARGYPRRGEPGRDAGG